MIRALIFDFNGVLVDDEHLHFELFRDILGEVGVTITERDYQDRFLGFDDQGCFTAALQEAGQDHSPELIERLIVQKAKRYQSYAAKGLSYFPGAAEVLNLLADQWPVVICSGALRGEIEYALTELGVIDRISAIVAAEDTTRCKPDPEGYLLAWNALRSLPGLGLDQLAPAECLVLEDSLAGVEAGKAAGMRVVGVPHSYPVEALWSAGADQVIPDLASFSREWIRGTFGDRGSQTS